MKHLLPLYVFIACFLCSFPAWSFDQNHTLFDKVLKKNTSAGIVNYQSFKKNPETLHQYCQQLTAVTPKELSTWSDNQQIAFWINAYNAYTLKLIIDHHPLKSIKDLRSPWKKKFIPLLQKTMSLDDIEHGILRKQYDEPRIHFALVCASRSCPPLLNEAYQGSLLEKQLQLAGQTFLNSYSRNRFDLKEKTLYLSKVFKWYRKDFEKKYESVGEAIKPYLSLQARGLIQARDYKIKFLEYDWRLNGI